MIQVNFVSADSIQLMNQAYLILIRFMIHMIQLNSLPALIYLYTYIKWTGFNSSVYECHRSHNSSLVNWFDSTFLDQIDSIHLMIHSGFSKNESIHLIIQAVMKKMIFD